MYNTFNDSKIAGVNSEIGCGQWEYQLFGVGIKPLDDSIVAKYILHRLSETYNVLICWESKPFDDLPGNGMHVNFSTDLMRDTTERIGMVEIDKAIDKLRSIFFEKVSCLTDLFSL